MYTYSITSSGSSTKTNYNLNKKASEFNCATFLVIIIIFVYNFEMKTTERYHANQLEPTTTYLRESRVLTFSALFSLRFFMMIASHIAFPPQQDGIAWQERLQGRLL